MGRVREIRRLRGRVRWARRTVGDPVLGRQVAAVTELVDRLNMIKLLGAAIGPIKTRDRGGAGRRAAGRGRLTAQLAGEEFLVGLDRYRADAAGQVLAAVPGSVPRRPRPGSPASSPRRSGGLRGV